MLAWCKGFSNRARKHISIRRKGTGIGKSGIKKRTHMNTESFSHSWSWRITNYCNPKRYNYIELQFSEILIKDELRRHH